MTRLKHEIHTSSLKSFQGCRLRYHWHFEENYNPVTTAKPLEFGVAYHKAMEVLYNPDTWDWDRDVVGELAIIEFINTCKAQRLAYINEQGDIDPEVDKDFAERVELGKGMLRYYYTRQMPSLDYKLGLRPVMVEEEFEVELRDLGKPIYCRCKGCQAIAVKELGSSLLRGNIVTFNGRIDCLMVDNDGGYWLFDWKTTAAIRNDTDEWLELDTQLVLYLWALKVAYGIDIKGFIYHEQRKAFPQPPPMNKVNRKGCWFSVSKQQATDYDIYLETIKAGDPDGYAAGSYEDFLQWLRVEGPVYYKRHIIHKTVEQLETAAADLVRAVKDMLDVDKNIYASPGRFACSYCAFRQPCLQRQAQRDPYELLNDPALFRVEEPYYVRRRGASTDSKGGE